MHLSPQHCECERGGREENLPETHRLASLHDAAQQKQEAVPQQGGSRDLVPEGSLASTHRYTGTHKPHMGAHICTH